MWTHLRTKHSDDDPYTITVTTHWNVHWTATDWRSGTAPTIHRGKPQMTKHIKAATNVQAWFTRSVL